MSRRESSRLEEEEHFERLIARLEARAGRTLAFRDWRTLAHLYRVQSGRLALLQTRTRDTDALRHLNALCLRAYTLIYAAPGQRGRRAHFLLAALPETLGRTWRVQLAAIALLVVAGGVGFALSVTSPRASAALVPASMYPSDALERLATSADARSRFLERDAVALADRGFFSGYLFVHNTRIGLMGFATGVLLGVPTLFLLAYNGLVLGAFAAPFLADVGVRWPFLAWLVPHAIPELLAIVLCATGGLLLGLAVVAPGRAGRSDALRRAGREALHLVIASVPLFLLAALTEGFVRESQLSLTARFGVAGLAIAALSGYVWLVRRLARRRPPVDVAFLMPGVRETPGFRSAPPGESRGTG